MQAAGGAVKREGSGREEDFSDIFVHADPLPEADIDGLLLDQMIMHDMQGDELPLLGSGFTPRAARASMAAAEMAAGATPQKPSEHGTSSSEGSGSGNEGALSHEGTDYADGPLLPLENFDDLIKMEDVLFSRPAEDGELDAKKKAGVKRCASSAALGSGSEDGIEEEDEAKRQARLLRNRESAQLSRQRKKAYLDELEKKLQAVNANNMQLGATVARLAAENAALRRQLAFFYQQQEQTDRGTANTAGADANTVKTVTTATTNKDGTPTASPAPQSQMTAAANKSESMGVASNNTATNPQQAQLAHPVSKVMPPPVFPMDPMYMPATVPGFPPPLVPGLPVPTTLPLPRLPLGAPGRGGTVSSGRGKKGSAKKRLKQAGSVATAVLSMAGIVMFADPFGSTKIEPVAQEDGSKFVGSFGSDVEVSWADPHVRVGRVLTSMDEMEQVVVEEEGAYTFAAGDGSEQMHTSPQHTESEKNIFKLSTDSYAALYGNSTTHGSIRVADMALVRKRMARLPSEAMSELGLNSTSFCSNTSSSLTIKEAEETYAGLEKLKDLALVSLHHEQTLAALPDKTSSATTAGHANEPIPGVLSNLVCSEMFRFKSESEHASDSSSGHVSTAIMGQIGRKALPAASTERQYSSTSSSSSNSTTESNINGIDDLSVSVLMPSTSGDFDSKNQVIVVVSVSDLDYVTYSCALDGAHIVSSTTKVV